MRGWFIFFFIGFIYTHDLCANNTINLEFYSHKNGLKTSNTNRAYKDSKGFMWFCARDGLFRYDSYSFVHINTLVTDTFNIETYSIKEDKLGGFWIGTNGNGVYYYNPHKGTISKVNLSQGGNATVFDMVIENNRIWIASSIGLLLIQDDFLNNNSEIEVQKLIPDPENIGSQKNSINVLLAIPGTPIIWVGSNGALYKFNTSTFKFTIVESNPQNSIRCIHKYNTNQILVGSWDGGVFVADTTGFKIETDRFITSINKVIGSSRVIGISIDPQNKIWVATYGDGLFVFSEKPDGSLGVDRFRNNNAKYSLKSDIINKLYLDEYGIVWLSMDQPALTKLFYRENNLTSFYLGNGNTFAEILSMNPSLDKSKFWISTLNSGIYLYNSSDHQQIHYTSGDNSALKLTSNNVSQCYQDTKGNLWIVDRRFGLQFVPADQSLPLLEGRNDGTVKPINANMLLSPSFDGQYVTKIYEDSDGRILVGTWGSFYIINRTEDSSKITNQDDLINNYKSICIFNKDINMDGKLPIVPVSFILEIRKHRYWIGTSEAGIIQLDETSELSFDGQLCSINNQLPSKVVNCIYKDANQGIWIGTSAGIGYMPSGSNTLQYISLRDGLLSEDVTNIIQDQKMNIWASTAYGIAKINPATLTVSKIYLKDSEKQNQYIINGSGINEFGQPFFSSNSELTLVNPHLTESSQTKTPVYFTSIKIDNQKIVPHQKYNGVLIIETSPDECKTINVPYNHSLSIEFAAIDYKPSEQTIYKYRIGNSKNEVILNPDQRSLVLPTMTPGRYKLEIMLANSPNKNGSSVIINYLPPFWLSRLAFAIYFCIVLVAFLIYRHITIQKIRKDSIIEQERQEKKKLQELDSLKTEFFSNISHEFRTPLSLILNPLEKLAKDNDLTADKKSKIMLALKSSQRLSRLTNELMDFSKIEKHLLIPHFVPCDIVSFIHEISQPYHTYAELVKINFKVDSPFDEFIIPIDTKMMEKVVFNLLSNAFKYTPQNGLIIINLTTTKNEKKDFLKLSVVNTGEGISKELLDKVFDRFYQVNNVQNQKNEGTGIGLSLVKSYVELHNGFTNAQSEIGEETIFDVYLPLEQESIHEPLEVQPKKLDYKRKVLDSSIALGDKKATTHYTLLIIEDDDEIRDYLANELSDTYKILTTQDGQEGLKMAVEIIPDIIISDVVMPLLTGTELCRILKSQLPTSHIPIILLSAKATIAQQIEGLETGADVYITKPFSIDHVRAQVNNMLNFRESIYRRYLKENTLIPDDSISSSIDQKFMDKLVSYIESNLTDQNLSVEQLSDYLGISRSHVFRKVKAISGMSIVQFIRTLRLKKASELIITNSELNYSEIAFDTGFSSPSYFAKCFKEHFGKSPSDFAANFKNNT